MSYTAAKALPTTKQGEFIDKNKFANEVLDENFEIFVIHVAVLEAIKMRIYPS